MTSSLVSFSKREIFEQLPGMQIADYRLEPAKSFAEPTILLVEDSYYYKPDIDGNQDRVFVNSAQIVESLAHMHVTSQLAARPDRHPAFFCIPNEAVDVNTLFTKYKSLVDDYLERQKNWFMALVRLADDDWQQLRRHNMISDVQRTAATELGLEREWLNAVDYEETKPACPFCGTNLLDSNTPICPNCGKVHNPERLNELERSIKARMEPVKAVK